MKISKTAILFKNFLLLSAIAVIVFICPPVVTAQIIGSASLDGFVTDEATSEPVSGAVVTVRDRVTKTERDGKFKAANLIIGRVIVEVKHKDYDNYNESISIARGENSFNIKLRPKTGRMALSNAIIAKKALSNAKSNMIEEDCPAYSGGHIASVPTLEESMQVSREEKNRNIKKTFAALKPSKDTIFVAGKVVDMISGIPISRAKVMVDDEVYFSDTNGEFISKTINKAQVTVRAESPNHTAYESSIKIGTGRNKLKILLMPSEREANLISHNGVERNATLEYTKYAQKYSSMYGTVRNARTHEPIANATIVIGSKNGKTNKEGHYIVDGLPLGFADVTVIAGKYGLYKGKVNVAEVSVKNDIALSPEEKTGNVTGTVLEKESGKAVYGARVQISDRIVVTDTFGNFSIPSVPFDYYNMIVEQKGYQKAEKSISVNQESVNFTVELADEFPGVK
ncbi:MAG TPA: carboxypeptidase regulatory-like domain-containing protein [Candidatus Wallbacteria bacterium]|nr:carboxypeptidase regulatory-like domain-containing protein [Candidatus Wallbacteria bacterium]